MSKGRGEQEQLIDAMYTHLSNKLVRKETAEIARLSNKKLTLTEVHTLSAISAEDVCPMRRVAEQLGVTLSTLTVSINRLVVKGYVSRIRSENDQRVVFLNLTQKGQDIVSAHEAYHNELIKCALSRLDDEEVDVFMRLFKKIDT